MKENPQIHRNYRSVSEGFDSLLNKDLTSIQNAPAISRLFAEYSAKMKETATRSDSPESAALYRLSGVCNPDVFPNAPRGEHKFFTNPAKDSSHQLYALAQYTQSLAPGAAYLRGVEAFTPQGIEPGTRLSVVEWHLDDDVVARVPVVFYDNTNEYKKIAKTVEILKTFENKVAVRVRYGTNWKQPQIFRKELSPLEWPRYETGGRLRGPILSALNSWATVTQPDTEFFDITLSIGSYLRKWAGGEVGKFFGIWLPDGNIWKDWSYKNTLYRIGNLSFENIFNSMSQIKNESIHLPMQILAAHAQTVLKGVSDRIEQRDQMERNWEIEQRRLEDESWNNF